MSTNSTQNSTNRNNEFVEIDITVKAASCNTDLEMILQHVRPNWKKNEIRRNVLTGGYCNGVFGFYHQDDVDNDDGIVIRVFAYKKMENELFAEEMAEDTAVKLAKYEYEIESMKKAAAVGAVAPVYARFNNGVVYAYAKGIALTPDIAGDDKVWPKIAETLAKFHAIKMNGYKSGVEDPMGTDKYRRDFWTSNEKQIIEKAATDPIYKKMVELVGDIKVTLEEFTEKYVGDSRIVFTHQDLNLFNIIWDPKGEKIQFIDFDVATYGYQAEDIAYQFIMSCGHIHEYDASLFPSEEFQMNWIRHYLRVWTKESGTCIENLDTEAEDLYRKVCKFVTLEQLLIGALLAMFSLSKDQENLKGTNLPGIALIHLEEYHRKRELHWK